MTKGPRDYTVKFRYGGETYYDIWEGDSADEVLNSFHEYVAALEWWDFHLAGGGVLSVRTAFIGGVEVFK